MRAGGEGEVGVSNAVDEQDSLLGVGLVDQSQKEAVLGGRGGGYSFVACLGRLTSDQGEGWVGVYSISRMAAVVWP